MKRISIIVLSLLALWSCDKPNPGGGGGGGEPVEVPVSDARAWDGVRRGEVFYEIFVRSFADSDGDGIGDLRGVIDKLDYIEKMGVTGIWLMPINPSPSYHGYDVTDYKAVNPQYGTMADFEELVAKAKTRGIKIVVDFVLNHSSSEHPWFKDAISSTTAQYRGFYCIEHKDEVKAKCEAGQVPMVDDNRYDPNVWKVIEGAGNTTDHRYIGAFSHVMPDFNYGDPKNPTGAYAEILDAAKFWMSKGAAGLRLDAVKHIYQNERGAANIDFLTKFYSDVKAAYPEVYMVGEVLSGMDDTAPFFKALPSLFHFDSWWKLEYALTKNVGKWYAKDMNEAIVKFSGANPSFNAATKLSNHDEDRYLSKIGGDLSRARMAIMAIMTTPGQPYIYYGEEVGMKGTKEKGDEAVREPLVWGDKYTATWRSTTAAPATVAVQESDKASLLNFYRMAVRLRNTYPALASGKMTFPYPENQIDGLMYWKRSSTSENIFVYMNSSLIRIKTATLEPLGSNAKPIFSMGGAKMVKTGDSYQIELPSYSILLIEANN